MPLWVQCSAMKTNFILFNSFSDIFLLAKPYVSQVTNYVKSFLVLRRNILNGEVVNFREVKESHVTEIYGSLPSGALEEVALLEAETCL